MAHLTEYHTILRIVNKEIPYAPPMGVMAGDAAHLPAAPLFGRVRLPFERMTTAAWNPEYVRLAVYMAMTCQTEIVDRLVQL